MSSSESGSAPEPLADPSSFGWRYSGAIRLYPVGQASRFMGEE